MVYPILEPIPKKHSNGQNGLDNPAKRHGNDIECVKSANDSLFESDHPYENLKIHRKRCLDDTNSVNSEEDNSIPFNDNYISTASNITHMEISNASDNSDDIRTHKTTHSQQNLNNENHNNTTCDEILTNDTCVDASSVSIETNLKAKSTLNSSKSVEPKVEVKREIKNEKTDSAKESVPKRIKTEKKTDRNIEDIIEPINRWWEGMDSDYKYNQIEKPTEYWTYMEHNGMIFTPEYVPHSVPITFKGEEMVLPPEIEEIATMWAQSIGTNYETSEIYCKNFWNVFTSKFEKSHPIRKSSSKLKDCDFSKIKEHLENEKQKKKDNKEFYQAKAAETAKLEHKFNYALVDWIREKVSSNKLEPPGLFKGRGLHPKQGLLKCRMFPYDVILNLSKDAPVPKVSNFQRDGHCWKDIYHDNSVTWLAYYRDSINDQFKYMYLAAQSKFKGLHDLLKYNKARDLKNYIEKIREDYHAKMLSLDMFERQIGTATYLIDFLALRVGGEKDADEADTVGCCSLRVEHIKFNDKKPNVITLDFLGKDSIRYFNTVTLNDVAYNNMVKFCYRKKPNAEIFNLINTTKLNDYLKEMMDGLSAKVFRTYNASITLQNQFKRLKGKKKQNTDSSGDVSTDSSTKPISVDICNVSELLQFYNFANREVAILCNHQRSIPKQHENSMSKLKVQADMLKEDIEELNQYIKHLESGSKTEFQFESKTLDVNGNPRKRITKSGMKLEACKNRLQTVKKRQKDHSIKMRIKDSNKTVALGTSKINYMDPRITVAFCKKYEIPIEKVFNKSLRMKFPWAMFVKSDFLF
ncbi:DNA topoisomerase type I, putative [Theileria equi strain WA]|uniref:DNA topoisomerase I n=1 Tax=Theileria equi strain WA TaxID=1537102 RepID=L0ATU3_THEEQ|nr:DNA topoisomerase type I, putative [Theileria equi strain WA]AFZ79067.1 DNA topoisomerase type I, putative [Theileria equi strain WA]|eukprot:XP_004828733.1 DNA topoisomerase type I, putative [Theileria equi strain WA]